MCIERNSCQNCRKQSLTSTFRWLASLPLILQYCLLVWKLVKDISNTLSDLLFLCFYPSCGVTDHVIINHFSTVKGGLYTIMIFRSLFIKKVSRDSEQAHAYLGTKEGGDCSHTKLPSGPQCLQINTKTEGKKKGKGGGAHTKQQQSLPCPKTWACRKFSEG